MAKRRCGYCGEQGHTRRNCSTLHERLKVQADNGSHQAANELKRLTQTKCSYCKEYGHNRRVCATRKQHIVTAMGRVEHTLVNVTNHFAEVGFGPGALLSYTEQTWCSEQADYVNKTYVGPVLSILWDKVDEASDIKSTQFYPNKRIIEVLHMDREDRRTCKKHLTIPREFWPDVNENFYVHSPEAKMVSPAFHKINQSIFSKANCEKMATAIVDRDYNRNKKR